ncbi:hypothetical protein [Thalassobacillus pellis]|nr:hypothetical protein [Thalassobacillus pellis]MBM7552993.1 hypothetical protein [Thalassobacillus pellis]
MKLNVLLFHISIEKQSEEVRTKQSLKYQQVKKHIESIRLKHSQL